MFLCLKKVLISNRMANTTPKTILVRSKLTNKGIVISVDNTKMSIVFPEKVWRKYPEALKFVLKDNLSLSSTFFVPQILNASCISYDSARPISEAFLFKNGIYDMSNSAHIDKKSSTQYVKSFINTTSSFASEFIKTPKKISFVSKVSDKKIVIPFTFGKDTLLTLALAEEVGLKTLLVYFVEPTHLYEYKHKKTLMRALHEETGHYVYDVGYGPGRMRYGSLWNKKTELGWGLQTTEYVLLSLPFLHYWNASLIAMGNEQSCKEAGMDEEGVLTHWAAYDQNPDWTSQQGLLASMITGRRVDVISLVEPLHELAEIAVLHGRYPSLAQFQTSCLANDKKAKNNRWCQNCEKCGVMYIFFKSLDIDVTKLGFTENLFDSKHSHLFKNLLSPSKNTDYYGVQEEVLFALYIAEQRGERGALLEAFQRKFLRRTRSRARRYFEEYLGIHKSSGVPSHIKKPVLAILEKQVKATRKEVAKFL